MPNRDTLVPSCPRALGMIYSCCRPFVGRWRVDVTMNDISEPIDVNRSSLAGSAPAGDVEPVYASSFDDFYRTHYRAAVRLGIALTGSPGVAEDLAQDVLTEAHRRWSQLCTYDNAAAWMRRALVNRAISRSRRLAVSARGLLRLRSQASTAPGVDLDERDWDLWRRVRALPARQAQLVALVYIEGLTLPVAAETLGIALSTAKTHLARAKDRLARDLADWSPS